MGRARSLSMGSWLACLLCGPALAGADRGPFNVIGPAMEGVVERWNAAHPDEPANLAGDGHGWRAFDLADNLHRQLRKNAGWCVGVVDVIWTAELADAGQLAALEEGEFPDLDQVFPSVVATGLWAGQLFAIPWITDAAFLYYRKDLVGAAPRTWTELTEACGVVQATQDIGCFATQLAPYEGLTCNFVEALGATGATVLAPGGASLGFDAGQAERALGRFVDADVVADEVSSYTEEDTRRAFQTGRVLFARNWPYQTFVWGAPWEGWEASSEVMAGYDIAPLPGETLDAGPGPSVLGGHLLAVGSRCAHAESARDFVRFATGRAEQRALALEGFPPVWMDVYDDPDVRAAAPHLALLKEVLSNAVARPASPAYGAVSRAIYEEAGAAIQRTKSVVDAVAAMRARITALVAP